MCHRIEDDYQHLAHDYLNTDDVVIARVDSSKNEIKGIVPPDFPMIVLYKAGGDGESLAVFKADQITYNGLKKFVENNRVVVNRPKKLEAAETKEEPVKEEEKKEEPVEKEEKKEEPVEKEEIKEEINKEIKEKIVKEEEVKEIKEELKIEVVKEDEVIEEITEEITEKPVKKEEGKKEEEGKEEVKEKKSEETCGGMDCPYGNETGEKESKEEEEL